MEHTEGELCLSAHEVCSSAQGQAWAESTCTVHTTPSCASGAMLCVMPCLYFRFPAGSASAGTMPFSAASTSTAVSSEGAGAAVWDGNERAEAEVLLTQQAGVRMTQQSPSVEAPFCHALVPADLHCLALLCRVEYVLHSGYSTCCSVCIACCLLACRTLPYRLAVQDGVCAASRPQRTPPCGRLARQPLDLPGTC